MVGTIRKICLSVLRSMLDLFSAKPKPGWVKSAKRNDLDSA
jgi:hypothetical protein